MTFDPGTWICHVCGDERPDARISVFSKKTSIRGLEVQENVRYCNDRLACIDGAPGVTFLGVSDGDD